MIHLRKQIYRKKRDIHVIDRLRVSPYSEKIVTLGLKILSSLGRWGGGGYGGYGLYMGYIGLCRCEGYDFQAVYSGIKYINQQAIKRVFLRYIKFH